MAQSDWSEAVGLWGEGGRGGEGGREGGREGDQGIEERAGNKENPRKQGRRRIYTIILALASERIRTESIFTSIIIVILRLPHLVHARNGLLTAVPVMSHSRTAE